MAHDLSEEREADMLEDISTTARATALREFVCEETPIRPDDAVLSVGCGPGFEPAALAERVGEAGRVHGVDANGAVLARARERCADSPEVTFQRGDVTALPVTDGAFDLAVAKQVLQFVDDIERALAELHRVVGPGGRVAVVAGDRRTGVIHASDPERARRANEIYRAARGDRHLGTRLRSLLPEAGFVVEDVVPRAAVRTGIDDQVERGIEVQRGFLEASEAFDDAAVEAWERDLRELDAAGEFLSCSTAFLYIGRKPETATTGPCPRERR